MSYKSTPLYGGAITVDLPAGFGDASTIRQIPDHQEVYLDGNGYASLVVDILEYQDKPTDEEALQYHFQDLIDGTGDSTNVLNQGKASMDNMGNKPVHILHFLQTPQPNPRRKEPEFVSIHLLLLRLKEQGTDIVISINEPHYAGEYVKAPEGQKETQLMKQGEEMAKKVLSTFDIKDWSLFNGA
ncbi:Mog1p/PsbP-like protein [Lophiostoma macrostomum CBS 122681]|uniref:Mog1p/PsbP-like protein n=1 Tax=Lophiostoma macrostomum CBS 122681 TaxID=1314788 RepID=A0A6A6TNT9_9PLEO|nr:Mog1p/PsbP-like protein [Lophiostoma macrostomum CBS 122681]